MRLRENQLSLASNCYITSRQDRSEYEQLAPLSRILPRQLRTGRSFVARAYIGQCLVSFPMQRLAIAASVSPGQPCISYPAAVSQKVCSGTFLVTFPCLHVEEEKRGWATAISHHLSCQDVDPGTTLAGGRLILRGAMEVLSQSVSRRRF